MNDNTGKEKPANADALKLFSAAQNALKRGYFSHAATLMQEYRTKIDYSLFPASDNRVAATPSLSVVIVAYKTKQDLIACVKSVLAGSRKDIEIIIVDNGGNEEVESLLKALPVLYLKMPINLVPSEGRNIGVAFAAAPIVAFLDDDAIAPKCYAQSILDAFAVPEVLAIRGKVLPKTENAFQGSNNHYDLGGAPLPSIINTEGCSAWNVTAYRQAGGMDPLLFGHEGTELVTRFEKYGLGASFYWPALYIYHDYAHDETKCSLKEQRHMLMTKYLEWKNSLIHQILLKHEEQQLRTYVSMIYGVPGGTEEDVKQSGAFIKRVRPDSVERNSFVGLPGSKLYSQMKEQGSHSNPDPFRFVSKALGTQKSDYPNQLVRLQKKPLVSVILPVFNAGAFISEAVFSILNQTVQDFEILILDDSSTDDTSAALASIRDSRIYIHRNEQNSGITKSLNELLAMARGKYIARMDADDISLPDRLGLQIKVMEEKKDVWVCGGLHTIFTGTHEHIRHLATNHDEIAASLLFSTSLPHPFVMFRGAVWKEHNIQYNPEYIFAQDYALWVRIFLEFPECRFHNVPHVIGRYRSHGDAISQKEGGRQRHFASLTYQKLIGALGLSDSLYKNAHKFFRFALPTQSQEDLIASFSWAGELRQANEDRKVFCAKFFDTNLVQNLLRIAGEDPSHASIAGKLLKPWKKVIEGHEFN